MRIIKIFSALLLVFSLVLNTCWARQGNRKNPWITARSFVVMDIDDGHVLYAKEPYLKLPAASTVKVMTAIIVLENSSLKNSVVISKNAAGTEPSKAYLGAGATYSTYDLLQALLISSANDAAVALAESISGTEDKFVVLMNWKAKTLGMKNTRFVNASGLPGRRAQHYTTAYDLAVLMRYASQNSVFNQILGMRASAIKGSDGRRIYLSNHNKLLRTHPKFVVGKTGYTMKAKHCFLGADHKCPKNIVFSILYSRNPWQDIRRLASYGLRLENNRKK
ncbi:MAG: serine hydrolase [Candidatus Omnitrophica bacterium]|nr:serine hydrolase [Candidatus Omnitrophota bacterium]MDD5236761.1 serine hydrolase [Candidatus Omnitrophota bacterium]MDD5610064.1 serine hydrolase [Candidatus Omnitrophota bacterium]